MEDLTEIDIWFGADNGCGRKVQGKYIGPSSVFDRISVKITDVDFLDLIGFESDSEPYLVDAYKLKDNHWVCYDDFAWSTKGEIKDEDLVNGELLGNKVTNDSVTNDPMRHLSLTLDYLNALNFSNK